MTKIARGVLTAVAVCSFLMFGATPSQAGDPCTGGKQTQLVGDACKAGGRDAAKKAMKGFLKEIQKKKEDFTCLGCHVELDPSYNLKPDGLKLFKEFGGK
jgi:hypothetical protein